ncbi:MAG TPA: LPS ABC transporter substrate-binding protein LptA, partial [Caulobacteraceae bacterium]
MTTKTRLIVAALAGAVLLTGAAVVQAQISPGGGPIAYSADTQAYEGNVLILSGRAELVQDGNRLRADTIRIFQADRPAGSAGFGGGDIQRMEAQSNVYFVTA